MADLAQDDLTAALALFWHPVCTLDELAASERRVLGLQLLGQALVVADLGAGAFACLLDRCLHRSTRLSVGWVDDGAIRCGYHGWRWGADGRCVEIPALPDGPIPAKACQRSFSVEERYGLLWVRLDDRAATAIPACPAFDDPTMKVVTGEPYTWPVSMPRRVENFTDLSHFAWVHDGTLGRRDEPVPPIPTVRREAGELRFEYQPPDLASADPTALVGFSGYRMPMPGTVNIEFDIAGSPGVRRHLWMTAGPLDASSCRTFWFVARNDAHDDPDEPHLEFQRIVLDEDLPLVCNQVPPELPLEPGVEVSVRSDRVSNEYRRWLREVVVAAMDSPAAVAAVLRTDAEVSA